jgi:hypothetical protein
MSVTLIIAGDALPDDVIATIGISPDRSWQKGERKSVQRPDGSTFVLDSRHEQSGWKFFIPEGLREAELQEQFRYWLGFISKHEGQLQRLSDKSIEISLDVFILNLEVVSLKPADLSMLGRCGVKMDWTFHV